MEDIVQSKIKIYKNYFARFVEVSDAEFINKIRNDVKLSRFISFVEDNVEKQGEWIKAYKERESKKCEYYFIIEDENGNKYGTIRLYNLKDDSFEHGSWVFLPKSPDNISIRSEIWIREHAFNELGMNLNKYEVRKLNKTVLMYHRLWNPVLVKEDENNFYFELSKKSFYDGIEHLRNIFNIND